LAMRVHPGSASSSIGHYVVEQSHAALREHCTSALSLDVAGPGEDSPDSCVHSATAAAALRLAESRRSYLSQGLSDGTATNEVGPTHVPLRASPAADTCISSDVDGHSGCLAGVADVLTAEFLSLDRQNVHEEEVQTVAGSSGTPIKLRRTGLVDDCEASMVSAISAESVPCKAVKPGLVDDSEASMVSGLSAGSVPCKAVAPGASKQMAQASDDGDNPLKQKKELRDEARERAGAKSSDDDKPPVQTRQPRDDSLERTSLLSGDSDQCPSCGGIKRPPPSQGAGLPSSIAEPPTPGVARDGPSVGASSVASSSTAPKKGCCCCCC